MVVVVAAGLYPGDALVVNKWNKCSQCCLVRALFFFVGENGRKNDESFYFFLSTDERRWLSHAFCNEAWLQHQPCLWREAKHHFKIGSMVTSFWRQCSEPVTKSCCFRSFFCRFFNTDNQLFLVIGSSAKSRPKPTDIFVFFTEKQFAFGFGFSFCEPEPTDFFGVKTNFCNISLVYGVRSATTTSNLWWLHFDASVTNR